MKRGNEPMKRKQKEELRTKGIEELAKEVEKFEGEIRQLERNISLARVKDTSLLKRKSDELAIIKTILGEKRYIKKI